MPSSSALAGAQAGGFEGYQALVVRHETAERLAKTVDPHSLPIALVTNISDSPASFVVCFVISADLSAVKTEGAVFAPLHLLPSPPPLPVAAAAELLQRKDGTLTLYSTTGGLHVLLVSVGAASTEDLEAYRTATWRAVTELHAKRAENAAFLIPPSGNTAALVDAIARIAILSNHSFSKYLTQQQTHPLQSLALLHDGREQSALLQRALSVACTVAEGTVFAREVACDRADTFTPSYMQSIAAMVAESHGLKMTVLSAEQLKAQGLYLLASVGQGSKEGEEARLVVLEYKGDPSSDRTIALCGKGVCFDAGGLHLKMTGEIESMHLDVRRLPHSHPGTASALLARCFADRVVCGVLSVLGLCAEIGCGGVPGVHQSVRRVEGEGECGGDAVAH